jgi:hypothetical protein
MTKYLIAVPAFVLFMMLYSVNSLDKTFFQHTPDEQYVSASTVIREERILDKRQQRHFDTIKAKYRRVDEIVVKDVLHYAYKYEKKSFPKAEDILAVIGIESSWNPMAKSKLKTDPALGLTQIRPGQWRKLIDHPTELLEIEKQIKYAAEILHINFKLTKSVEDAVIAYNVGYGSWLDGLYSMDYLTKFQNERINFRRTTA